MWIGGAWEEGGGEPGGGDCSDPGGRRGTSLNAQSSMSPAQHLSTPPPGESFPDPQHPSSPIPLPQPLTPQDCLLVWKQLESPVKPHPGPGLQEVSRKVQQMNLRAPPSRAAPTAKPMLFYLSPTHTHAHTLICILGQGPGGWDEGLGAGGALETKTSGKVSSDRVRG